MRAEEDPYTVFTMVNKQDRADQSIFFWLSIMCLLGAILMICALGCVYQLFISEESQQEIEMERRKVSNISVQNADEEVI